MTILASAYNCITIVDLLLSSTFLWMTLYMGLNLMYGKDMFFGNSEVNSMLCLLTFQISIWTISWQKIRNDCRYVDITVITKAQLKQSSFKLNLALKSLCVYVMFFCVYFNVTHLIHLGKFSRCNSSFLIIMQGSN